MAQPNTSFARSREFRYDGDGRQRYWSRQLLAEELVDGTPELVPTGDLGIYGLWTDYEGSAPYSDSALDDLLQDARPTRKYQPGGLEEVFDDYTSEPVGTQVLHGDLIGSAGATSDDEQEIDSRSAYTAFGERISLGGSPPPNVSSRYRYAGEWGYEEGLLQRDCFPGTAPIVLAHVGERWYDAGTGRFVQRDPIGVEGGINVYLYAEGSPTTGIDPTGLLFIPQEAIDYLFRRGGGLFNSNNWIRLGYGWKGTALRGSAVFRLSIGSPHWKVFMRGAMGTIHFHINPVELCVLDAAIFGTIGYQVSKRTGLGDEIGDWLYTPNPLFHYSNNPATWDVIDRGLRYIGL